MSGNLKPIHFPRSDGDPTHARWPTQRDFAPGGLNFQTIAPGEWHPVGLEESSSVSWRKEIGQAVAQALAMGPGHHILADWPDHYRLFLKGRIETASSRFDHYLIGGKSRVFRSRKEFVPHATWLFGNGQEPCTCAICTKSKGERRKSQAAGSSAIKQFTTPGSSRPSHGAKSSAPIKGSEPLPAETEPPVVYAEVHPSRPRPVLKDHNSRRPDVYDRLNDIRAMSRKSDPVLHREGELVWCALQRLIPTPAGEDIAFWPGAIKSVNTRPHLDDVEPGSSTSHPMRQTTTYAIHLLAISRARNIREEDVLPYQAYKPSQALIQAMKSLISQRTHYPDDAQNRAFNPFREDEQGQNYDFEDAAPPYALAVQIAANVSARWCLTDEWEFQFMPPLPRDQLIPSPPGDPLSEVSHEEVMTKLLGAAPTPMQINKQTRFQGLWWGGERIWIEDMVRLKFPRSHLAPQGAPNILAPSSPTDAAKQRVEDGKQLVAGAFSRGTFLKLEGIMVVDIPQPQRDGIKKDIRLCGSLYELADIDFEDTQEPYTSTYDPIYPNGQISSPGIVPSNPLPPTFSKFRRIQVDGSEVVTSLTMLAGRYYPRLPGSRMEKMVEQYINAKELKLVKSLVALDGTTPGFLNCVDAQLFMLDRKTMFDESHECAASELARLRRKKTPLFLPSDDDEGFITDSMDVS